jgi:hypothetical protein
MDLNGGKSITRAVFRAQMALAALAAILGLMTANFVFLRDVWNRTQRATVARRRATN